MKLLLESSVQGRIQDFPLTRDANPLDGLAIPIFLPNIPKHLYIKLILGCEGGVSEICLHRSDMASIGSLSENQIDDRHTAKVHRNAHLVFNTIAPSLIHCESGYKDHVLPTNIYRPQRSWAKVIFSQASVCRQGGGEGCLPQCMLGYTPPRTRPHLGADTPPREADSSIRSTSGRYASYWNAFLFCIELLNMFHWKLIVTSKH